jgi:hypothetical protein
VKSAEENRANFCPVLDGKPLLALSMIYTVVLKVNAQAGQSEAVKKPHWNQWPRMKTSQEVKRCKRHSSNDTSQTARKSTKPVPTSTTLQLPPKAVLTCNFFAPLRTNYMDTETTGAENALPDNEAASKLGRPPPIVMTSTTNLIQLQSDLKEQVKGEYEF